MKIGYRKRFLKQLARLPAGIRTRVEDFAFEQLPNASSIADFGGSEKMQGPGDYYKSCFGAFRVGMELDADTLILKVVMDRKDIYKYFP